MGFVTRMGAAIAGTRVAAAAGKYGIFGTAAGLLVTSAVLRWPGKAALVGAALAARTIWAGSQKPVTAPQDTSHDVPSQLVQSADDRDR